MQMTMAERIKLKDDVKTAAQRYGLPINDRVSYEVVVRIVKIERQMESVKAALRPLNAELHKLIKQRNHLLNEAGWREK